MDSPNKKKLGNGIRTRSSRDSSVEDLTEDRVKGSSPVTGAAKAASGVSTRHHTYGCDAAIDNARNFGLEFPMGRRRRKFPKAVPSLDPSVKPIGARQSPLQVDSATRDPARTRLLARQLPPVEKPHTRNGDRRKSIVKSNVIAPQRLFERRRRRNLAGEHDLSKLEHCGVKLERLSSDNAVLFGKDFGKGRQGARRARKEHQSSLEDSLLDGSNASDNESTTNCTEAQKVNSSPRPVPKHGTGNSVGVSQKRKRTRSGEHGANDSGSMKNHCSDEQSLSGSLSIDGNSRDSTEQGSRTRDGLLSAHEADSDDGSVTTTDSHASSNRQRRRSELGNSHRTGIDFRVGGRLEARDYLNMWYPSRIIQVDWDDKEVLIHFERWNSRFDEWVSMDSPRLRSITRTSTRKDKDCPFPVAKVGWADLMRPYNTYRGIVKSIKNEFKVGEVIMAKWTDCKMYPAKIVKINSDLSYNVLFYDGFERIVQYINIKKLPSDFSGDLNFKESPPKSDVKRKRSTSGSKKGDETEKEDENEKAKAQSLKNKVEPNKLSLEKDSPLGEKQKPKSVNSSPLNSNHKGNGAALPNKRRKLLVGGIFQAKRHQLAVRIGENLSTPNQSKTQEKAKSELRPPKANKKLEVGLTEKPSNEKETPIVSSATPNISETDVAFTNNTLFAGFVPPCKAFVIEEDHNHFKCLIEGCGKAFRKDVLLASHMKHYHSVKRKINVDKLVEKKPEPVGNMVSLEQQPSEQLTLPVKNEGNVERKLITEKRRQRLLQKKLDKQYNQAAAAVAAQQQQQLPKPTKKPQGPADIIEENVENSPVNKLPVKSERSKSRKRKYLLTARGVVAKLKKKKMEGDEKSKILDGDLGQQNLSAEGVVPDINPHLEPISSKMFMKPKPSENKAINAKLGKEFGIYRSGQKMSDSSSGVNCELREEIVNCRCQVPEEDGLMMQCEVCLAWQHGACFDIEDEDKVPDKYICYACENPKGQRQSFKYKHNQDWFKLGELATFRFLPKRDTWSLKENMLKTHNLASQLISVSNVLHALQCKLQIAKEPKHSSLVLWSQPWQGTRSNLDSPPNHKKPFHIGFGTPASGQNGSWTFGDHSYSVPNRGFPQNEFLDNSCAFLADQCDDKSLCFDVAAHEVLDAQGMGPPFQEEVVETSLATSLTPKMQTTSQEKSEPNVPCLEDTGSDSNTILIGSLRVPKDEPGIHNLSGTTNEEENDNAFCPPATPTNNADSKKAETSSVDKKQQKERRIFFPSNSKKSIPETFDIYSCQINLLDHVEHLQEELDRRLDELNQQLEFLESDFESPSLSSSDDTLADVPRVKKLLKTLENDLMKVQRMALYC